MYGLISRLPWMFAVLTIPAYAGIDPKRVCDANNVVDKNLLAAEILDIAKVSHRVVHAAEISTGRDRNEIAPMPFLIEKGPDACDLRGFSCSKDGADLAALSVAAIEFAQFKINGAAFADLPDEAMPPGAFFSDDRIVVRCIADATSGAPVAGPVAKKTAAPFQWRVRGKADDLFVPQGADRFKTIDKATVAFSQDDVKGKRVRAVNGVVGASFQLADRGLFTQGDASFVELVPFFGITSNVTKEAGKTAAVASNLRTFGVTTNGYEPVKLPYFWSARAQYTRNLVDDSRLVTASLRYLPVLLDQVNSERQFSKAPSLWFQWLFDARYYHGNYTSLGTRLPEKSRDFDRIGTQVGVGLSRVDARWPWDLSVTETGFYGFSGEYKTFAQFKSTFSLWFDYRKLFGIDLTYTNGRDGETAERDKSWKVGLGFKY